MLQIRIPSHIVTKWHAYTLQLFSSVEPPSLAWFKFQDLNYRFGKKIGRDLGYVVSSSIYWTRSYRCLELRNGLLELMEE